MGVEIFRGGGIFHGGRDFYGDRIFHWCLTRKITKDVMELYLTS